MSNIEKIRQEIKQLRKLLEDHNYYLDNSEQALGYSAALNDIEKFLDTLSEEPDKGLDVTDFCKPIDPGIAQCAADHWWEMMDEEPDKSMEEAAREYVTTHLHNNEFPTADSAFIAGAKWQAEKDKETIKLAEDHAYLAGAVNEKEQMLKDAVEGEFANTPFPTICLDDCKDYNFKDNQKVRIIVLKAEEE